jgi:hypothetical protein
MPSSSQLHKRVFHSLKFTLIFSSKEQNLCYSISLIKLKCGSKGLVKRRKYVRIFNLIYSLWVLWEEKSRGFSNLVKSNL